MRVIIAGGRNRFVTDAEITAAMRAAEFKPTCIVSGGAPGVDQCGLRWARNNKLSTDTYPADWATYGPGAGPRRNQDMANTSDALLAFPDKWSPGTRDMIRRAERKGLPVFVVSVGGLNG